MQANDHTEGNVQLFRAAMSYLRKRLVGWRLVGMVVSVGLMGIAGWLANVPALLVGTIFDDVVDGNATTFKQVVPALALIGGAVFVRELVTWIRKFIVERVATNVERDEFVEIIRHFLAIDISSLIDDRAGALNTRINRSIDGVIRLVKLVFLDFLPISITAAIAFYIATSRHWGIGAVMLGVLLITLSVTWKQIKSQKGIRIQLIRAKEEIGAKVVDLFDGIDYVRASGAVPEEQESARTLANYLRQKEFLHHRYMMTFDSVKQLIEGLGFVGVIGLGAWFAGQGTVSVGEVATFAMLYMNVAAPLRELHRIIDEGFEVSITIHDLAELYNRPRDIGLSGTEMPRIGSDDIPAVECEQLSVKYQKTGKEVQQVLKNVDLVIRQGEVIGIAGPSGSGKSTLIKVLLGLNPHYCGSAKVFGVEVRSIDKNELAALTAYVPQRPFILKGSVRENILYGTPQKEWKEQELWEAMEKAQIAQRIREFPELLSRQIAERGRNLSGGEQQRIVLTRVFLKGAELVILDEATAALDTVNEKLVQDAIGNLIVGKTAIVIAHRLSTLRIADKIIVFDRGKIIQSGTYDELARAPGLFQTLVEQDKSDREVQRSSTV